MKDRQDYSCAKHLVVHGRVIIVDVPLSTEKANALSALATVDGKGSILLDASKAAELLEVFFRRVIDENNNVLFVFPGNGADYPRSLSAICRETSSVEVFAKRLWTPGSEPIAIVGTFLPEPFMNLWVKTIVVVDDVISSGQTMFKLHQNNSWRFPKAKWIGATWVSQSLHAKSSSGIKGYSSVFASFLVEGQLNRKVPINSLSTLREIPEMAKNYARRHYVDVGEFLRLIG